MWEGTYVHCAVWPLPHLCALCLRVSLTCFLVQEALRELLAAKMTEAICNAEERMVQRVAVAGNRDSTEEEVCATVSLWSKHRRAWRGSRGIVSISTSIISICYCLVFLLKLIVTLQAKGYLDGEAGTAYSSKVYFELPSSGEWCVHRTITACAAPNSIIIPSTASLLRLSSASLSHFHPSATTSFRTMRFRQLFSQN